MSRLLVTGFAPFLGDEINPTQKIAEILGSELADRVDAAVLPVSFARAGEELGRLWRPDHGGALMFGQARGRGKISLERVALNWTETPHPDEDGVTPAAGPIAPGEDPALINGLPLADWRARLDERVPTEISLSAGGYVCNHVLYQAARRAAGRPYLFVHVPVLPGQVKAGEPSMPFETMLRAARELVDLMFAAPEFGKIQGARSQP